MHKILIAALFAAVAMPAFATDSGDAAFDILSRYTPEEQQTNYIKLQSSIDMADAMRIDAKISEIYGAPQISRSGLKVWHVENTSGSGGKHTTIMCGPDTNGGVYISADRRGKARKKVKKGAEKKRVRQSQDSKPEYSKSKPASQERD